MFSNLSPFTKLHVVISLIGIVSGLVVMFGLLLGQKLKPMDRVVFDQHSGNERDGILLSVSRCNARDRRRNHFLGSVGGRDRRTIRSSSRRVLALDLCGHGDDLALSECLRSSRATFSKGAGAESFGAHTVRAAIRCYATCRPGAVCLSHHSRRDQVSR